MRKPLVERQHYSAVILAASRGPDDPMAVAYGVQHKCLLPVGGVPMLARVVRALEESGVIDQIFVSTDAPGIYRHLSLHDVEHVASLASAPLSAIAAIEAVGTLPVLITTGDHALLTPEMVRAMCEAADDADADFTAGLATRDTIQSAYPQTNRTYFRLGSDHVSGCNLFTIHNERGFKVLQFWSEMEKNRKKPWKLALAFGFKPLLKFALGKLTLESAFAIASEQLGARIKPVLLPFAEAAIDVDKPADKELAEEIVKRRGR